MTSPFSARASSATDPQQASPASAPGLAEPSPSSAASVTLDAPSARLATVSGTATDPTGALLQDARVQLTGCGPARTTVTDHAARFTLQVEPGDCELLVEFEGFAPFHRRLQLRPGEKLSLLATLPIAFHAEELSVPESNADASSDPTSNQDALVFGAGKLATLSDDDATLQRQLLSFAGGGEPDSARFFIDGFSGGRFPPKDTIREIRINQNPYSAQYDRRGFGRIDVFTKPGSSSYHGSARLSGNDRSFNGLNPYTGAQPPYHSETLDANVNGPLGRRTSFFVAASAADNQSNVAVNAMILDGTLAPLALSRAIPNPSTLQTYSLRLDHQFSPGDTFIGRYEFNKIGLTNGAVGQLTLPSEGFGSNTTTQTLQLGNTVVLGKHLINETRFQYIRTRLLQTANDSSPTLIVQGAFNGGGNPAQTLRDNQDAFEFQEYLSLEHGKHFFRVGTRYRLFRDANVSTANYNGQYIFPSLAAYRITLQGMQQRLSPAAIRALGGGPTQFNLTVGTPSAAVLVGDLAVYAEDEWRATPSLTFTVGTRLESQTGIPDHFDPAPRGAVSWAIRNRKAEPPLVVLRAGAGLFFDRFAPGNILQTVRQNGVLQTPFYIERPDFFPSIPDPATLTGAAPTTYLLDPRFRSTYSFTSSVSADHTWTKFGSMSLNFTSIHAVHLPTSLNINAPLPGTYNPAIPGSGTRPLGGTRAVYQYTAEGINNARTLFLITNLQPWKRLALYSYNAIQWRSTDVSGANNFPSNQYNLEQDLGRSGFLLQNRGILGATLTLPHGFTGGLLLSANTGLPFNITIGQDINGDTQFNDRPAFATDLTRPSVVRTAFGNFDTAPLPSQTIIPINYGNAPAYVSVQLRVGKSFGIGPRVSPAGSAPTPARARKYKLELSAEATNVLNHPNPAPPIGVLSSPFFGRSIDLSNEETDNTAANRLIRLFAAFRF